MALLYRDGILTIQGGQSHVNFQGESCHRRHYDRDDGNGGVFLGFYISAWHCHIKGQISDSELSACG